MLFSFILASCFILYCIIWYCMLKTVLLAFPHPCCIYSILPAQCTSVSHDHQLQWSVLYLVMVVVVAIPERKLAYHWCHHQQHKTEFAFKQGKHKIKILYIHKEMCTSTGKTVRLFADPFIWFYRVITLRTTDCLGNQLLKQLRPWVSVLWSGWFRLSKMLFFCHGALIIHNMK